MPFMSPRPFRCNCNKIIALNQLPLYHKMIWIHMAHGYNISRILLCYNNIINTFFIIIIVYKGFRIIKSLFIQYPCMLFLLNVRQYSDLPAFHICSNLCVHKLPVNVLFHIPEFLPHNDQSVHSYSLENFSEEP